MNHWQQTEELVSAVKNLRKVLKKRAKRDDLQMVADFLFAGNAQVETDNLGQLVVYTGYTYGTYGEDLMTLDRDEHGFSRFWCMNDE
jgi:proline racemase